MIETIAPETALFQRGFSTTIPVPSRLMAFLGRQNAHLMGQGQSGQGDMESPPDFSFWAAAIALILTAAFIYSGKYLGPAGSIIAGLVAAYFIGSVFNAVMRILIFLIKLAIYTAIIIAAGYYFMRFFPDAQHIVPVEKLSEYLTHLP